VIRGTDVVRLAPDVRIRPEGLEDDVRGVTSALNETGRAIVERLDGRQVREVAAGLAAEFDVEQARVGVDVAGFCGELNRLLLANVERRGPSRLALRRRRAVDTRSIAAAVRDVALALLGPAACLALLAAGLVAGLTGAVGSPSPGYAAAAGLGGAAGFVLHEAGHAAALSGVAAALCRVGSSIFVLHAAVAPRRGMLVAAAGPASAALAGLAGIAISLPLDRPELAVGALSPALHSLALTVAARDGRVACGLL
jgi:Coenzyme PQQ synthesis protein D (PqqD)